METLATFLSLLAGILLRIGIPVALTVVVVGWLRRMDANWQAAAEHEGGLKLVGNCGCWEINGCPPEKRAACAAYADRSMPCWQVHRRPDGTLQENCLDCQVLKHASIPVTA